MDKTHRVNRGAGVLARVRATKDVPGAGLRECTLSVVSISGVQTIKAYGHTLHGAAILNACRLLVSINYSVRTSVRLTWQL